MNTTEQIFNHLSSVENAFNLSKFTVNDLELTVVEDFIDEAYCMKVVAEGSDGKYYCWFFVETFVTGIPWTLDSVRKVSYVNKVVHSYTTFSDPLE